MENISRKLLERLVTKDDYFHIPHTAEPDPTDPCQSYYYDLRARVDYPGALENGLPVMVVGNTRFVSPIGVAQFGLAHLQHYWDTGDEQYLRRSEEIARAAVDMAERSMGLVWRYPIYVRGNCGWISSMMQGQIASLLLRVGRLTGDKSLLDKGKAALTPLEYDIEHGGVRTTLNGHLWFEEYAILPPAFTLNGFIVTLFALRDAAIILEDSRYHELWNNGVDSLIGNLQHFDLAGWSLYDLDNLHLGPLSLNNPASPFYHRFHIELLVIMERLTGESAFIRQRQRWSESLENGSAFYRGVFGKALYRVFSPVAYARV